MKKWYILCLGIFIIFTSRVFAATAFFISVSDIHYDPFTICEQQNPRGTCPLILSLMKANTNDWPAILAQAGDTKMIGYGHDTNHALLLSTIKELNLLQTRYHPAFMLLLGDYLAHHFQQKYIQYSGDTSQAGYQSFVRKTFQFLTNSLRKALPDLAIYPVIGNNDSYHGDYDSDPHGAFYQDTAKTWSILFSTSPQQQRQFLRDFPNAGYYAILPTATLKARILVLNTVLFSVHTPSGLNDAAQAELLWLRQQLAAAQRLRQLVFLVFHIPVGIDAYKTITSGATSSFWNANDTASFLSIIQQYAPTIHGIFSAHIHMDSFNIFRTAMWDSYTPSISPIFGNNAGIKVFKYDNQHMLITDFTVYYLALNQALTQQTWQQLYDFNEQYQPQCQGCLLGEGVQQLKENNDLVSTYTTYFGVNHSSAQPVINPAYWRYYWCAISHFMPTAYEHCIKQKVKKIGAGKIHAPTSTRKLTLLLVSRSWFLSFS